jgi:protein-L-isoaspartate(D-aspartate) O-methyltransferase
MSEEGKRIALEDRFSHKKLREALVTELAGKGITDKSVLAAIGEVPRHYFLDSAFDKIAYEDRAFPIAAGQTISHPYTVAYQTQLLKVKPGDRILEIGTGSMYQTAILAKLGAEVFTVERQRGLVSNTKQFKKLVPDLSPQVRFFFGDGFKGIPNMPPFDKIIITAAAPKVPEKLWEQLKVKGIMVIPVDETETEQRMLRLTKKKDGLAKTESFEIFSFVPMLKGKDQDS